MMICKALIVQPLNKYLNKEKWLLILSFILGVGMLYILWPAVSFFITSLTSADPTISAAIIGAMATIFVVTLYIFHHFMMICKALIVQPLSFKASKKSFHHRIISAVTTPTHTLSNAFALTIL
jgi:hypothetical protein